MGIAVYYSFLSMKYISQSISKYVADQMVTGYCFRFACLLYISFKVSEVLHSLSPLYIGANSTLQSFFVFYSLDVTVSCLVKPSATSSFEVKQIFAFLCILVTKLSLESQNLWIFFCILRELTVMTYSCSLINPTIGSCEQEVEISSTCSVYEANLFHLIKCIYQNLEDVHINKCSGSKCKQAKESESSLSNVIMEASIRRCDSD